MIYGRNEGITARMKVQPNIALQTWQLLFGIVDDMREHALTRHSRKEVATFRELTISQQHMIKAVIRMTIDTPEGVTLKALADRLQLSSGAASAMVEVLVRKQILERTPARSTAGRSASGPPTNAGDWWPKAAVISRNGQSLSLRHFRKRSKVPCWRRSKNSIAAYQPINWRQK